MSKLSVKNVKEAKFMSQETICFTASVYFNGKKIGTAENAGHGGNTMIYPDPGKRNEFVAAEKWALAQPAQEWEVDWQDDPMIVESNMELLIDDLVVEFLDNRDWKRRCKTQTCFTLKGDNAGAYRTVNHPYDAGVAKYLANKYGDDIAEVINERFQSEVTI
jgi:hypothetical protein